jgi:hypothetical protein
MLSPNRLYELLRKLSILVALSLFVFSVIYPFYHITFGGLEVTWANYWSYRAEHTLPTGGYPPSQFWFSDYWFIAHVLYIDAYWIPFPMFISQALTLGLAVPPS